MENYMGLGFFSILSFISLAVYLFFIVTGGYLMILGIKALRLYLKNNSQ